MDEARVIVVGAGVSGLTSAAILADRFPVTIVDRLLTVGGIFAGQEAPLVQARLQQCKAAGVELVLGATALRWSRDRRLLVVAPNIGCVWRQASWLVFAGGTRPSTLAEMRIFGDRIAGVFPATAAYHFLEAGIGLGRRVAILGAGAWAERLCPLLASGKSRTILISSRKEVAFAGKVDERWMGWMLREVHGSGRVSALTCERQGQQVQLQCDAVILASDTKPVRNVDGAIGAVDNSAAVTFVQYAAEHETAEAIANHAEKVTLELIETLGGAHREGKIPTR